MLTKQDKEFLQKVAKTATEANKSATKALRIASEAKALAERAAVAAPPASSVVTSAPEPTQTWVQFGTPQELQQHASSIMLLNQDVDKLCKALGVKELRITYKKP